MTRNTNRVPRRQWDRWSGASRRVFNAVYKFMLDNPWVMRHPKQTAVSPAHWKTTAWNAAWIAADAVDDRLPDEVVEIAA